MKQRALAAITAGCFAGCASHSGTGMTTRLEPGQRRELVASGDEPTGDLVNHGPGTVHVEYQGNQSFSLEVAPRATSQFHLSQPASIVNRSSETAGIQVRITGARSTQVRAAGEREKN